MDRAVARSRRSQSSRAPPARPFNDFDATEIMGVAGRSARDDAVSPSISGRREPVAATRRDAGSAAPSRSSRGPATTRTRVLTPPLHRAQSSGSSSWDVDGRESLLVGFAVGFAVDFAGSLEGIFAGDVSDVASGVGG